MLRTLYRPPRVRHWHILVTYHNVVTLTAWKTRDVLLVARAYWQLRQLLKTAPQTGPLPTRLQVFYAYPEEAMRRARAITGGTVHVSEPQPLQDHPY